MTDWATEKAKRLFNTKKWCDADAAGLRGLEDHVPLLAQALREARAEGLRDAAYWMDLFAGQNEANGSSDRAGYLRAFAEDIRVKAARGRFRMHDGEDSK